MNKTKDKLPKVGDCIAYIESCGWMLDSQYRGIYYFQNVDANMAHKLMRFTLTELRHAFKYGW